MQTIAEILSYSLLRLGKQPADILTMPDVSRIARSRIAFYLLREQQGEKQSGQNFQEFSISSNGETDLPNISSPAWVERRAWTGETAGTTMWEYVPTVNIDSLEEWRGEGRPAVSFYKDGLTGILKMRVSTDWGAGSRYKVWYDTDLNLQQTIEDGSGLPEAFNYMISADIRARVIGLMLNNAARMEEEKPLSQTQLLAWQAMKAEAESELVDYRQAFEEHRNKPTGVRRGRNRRPILRNRAY